MQIHRDFDLQQLNTLRIPAKAEFFTRVTNIPELTELLKDKKYKNMPKFILGGGSNIVLTKDVEGLTIKMEMSGVKVIKEAGNEVFIEAEAGKNWHDLVTYCTKDLKLEGIENLAYVPGTTGGAISQNIACYGQNISDVFVKLSALNTKTLKIEEFTKDQCDLRYRSSFFKKHSHDYIVLSVLLKLFKEATHLETNYHERRGRHGSVEEELKSFAKEPYTPIDVYEAVVRQRKKRLPDVETEGTCGSTFTNPVVSLEKFRQLESIISELQSYPVEKLSYEIKEWEKIKDSHVKIPAGRLFDELGWKGKWVGNVGVSSKHALCVVTNMNATADEVVKFINAMHDDVLRAYDIDLVSELVFV